MEKGAAAREDHVERAGLGRDAVGDARDAVEPAVYGSGRARIEDRPSSRPETVGTDQQVGACAGTVGELRADTVAHGLGGYQSAAGDDPYTGLRCALPQHLDQGIAHQRRAEQRIPRQPSARNFREQPARTGPHSLSGHRETGLLHLVQATERLQPPQSVGCQTQK